MMYELIGQIVVVIGFCIFAGIVALLSHIVWNIFWSYASNIVWDNKETVWRTQLAGVFAALARFQIRKIPEVYREATRLAREENE